MDTRLRSDSWPLDDPDAVLAPHPPPPVSGATLLPGNQLHNTDAQPCILIENSQAAVAGVSNWLSDLQPMEASENPSDERILTSHYVGLRSLNVSETTEGQILGATYTGHDLTASRRLTAAQEPLKNVTRADDIPNNRSSSVSQSASLSQAAQAAHESGCDASVGQQVMKQVDEFDMGYETGIPLPEMLHSAITEFHSTHFSGLYGNLDIAVTPEVVTETEEKPDGDAAMKIDAAADASLNADPRSIVCNESLGSSNDSHTWSSVSEKHMVVDCDNDVRTFHTDMSEASGRDELQKTLCHKMDGIADNSNPNVADRTELSSDVNPHSEISLKELVTPMCRQPHNIVVDSEMKESGISGASDQHTCMENQIMPCADDNTGIISIPRANQTIGPEKCEISPDREMECGEPKIRTVEQSINTMVEKTGITELWKHHPHDIDAAGQVEQSARDTINMACNADSDFLAMERMNSEKILISSGTEVEQKDSIIQQSSNILVGREIEILGSLDRSDCNVDVEEKSFSNIHSSECSAIKRIESENLPIEMERKEHVLATAEKSPNIAVNGGRHVLEGSCRFDSDVGIQPEGLSFTSISESDLPIDQKNVLFLDEKKKERRISIIEHRPVVVDCGLKTSDSSNKYDRDIISQPEKQISSDIKSIVSGIELPLHMVVNISNECNRDIATRPQELPCVKVSASDLGVAQRTEPEDDMACPSIEQKCDGVAVVDCGVAEKVEPVIIAVSSMEFNESTGNMPQQHHNVNSHDRSNISESLTKNNAAGLQHEGQPCPVNVVDMNSLQRIEPGTAAGSQTSVAETIKQPLTMIISSELSISESLNTLSSSISAPDVGPAQRLDLRKAYPSTELERDNSTLETLEQPLDTEANDGIKDSEVLNSHPNDVDAHLEEVSCSEKEEIQDGENGVDHYKLVRLGDESDPNLGDITSVGLSDEARVNREQELNEVVGPDDNPDVELLQRTKLDDQLGLDADVNMRSTDSYADEGERNALESVQEASNLQDNFDPSSEIADFGQHQHRKRGRRPGKKVIGNEEKQATDIDALEHQPRKRGRKLGAKASQKEEEDVCFVCYDGGKLILCDKRSCPKAYHIECTGRESDFFQKRGQWFCGWHVCSQCSRAATIHCFTCPRALCNACLKEANFQRITKNRGLCEGCFAMVHMIENNETVNAEGVEVDFNDHDSFEGLFNDYWQDIKLKHSITSANFEKLRQSKDDDQVLADVMTEDPEEAIEEEACGSSDSEDKPPTMRQLRLMKRKRLTKSSTTENLSASDFEGDDEDDDEEELENVPKKSRSKAPEFDGWASKELLEMIKHMKEDPKKQLSLLGIKKLLWRYIDECNLTNPRRRGQIVCDERLQKLFGKKHVGRMEMMKLISLHVASPVKYAVNKSLELRPGENDGAEFNGGDENWPGKKKSRRKGDDKYLKVDPSEYAAINVKNINLIYLKRSVLDELRNDPDLENKVVGAFVRIRVPGMVNKNDTCYRLVQIVGAKQIYDAIDPEKVTDVILEILNLDKREELTADLVSNQDFLEEECQRLRQSVRYGFIKAMTVGELEERAKALREAKVKDWFEAELLRLSHLRDRASETGRKRELRECVEKLQLLNSPEEKEKRLNAPFDIDVDPHMDPSFESDDEDLPFDENSGDTTAGHNMQEKTSATENVDRMTSVGGTAKFQNHWDNGILEYHESQRKPYGWIHKSPGWAEKDSGRKDTKLYMGMPTPGQSSSNERKSNWGDGSFGKDKTVNWNVQGTVGRKDVRWMNNVSGMSERSGWGDDASNVLMTSMGINALNNQAETKSSISIGSSSSIISPAYLSGAASNAGTTNITSISVDNEKEKIWCYQDPTKTIQGPFSMEQLRKWEKTNLFPLDLQIWRVTESQDASILLTDALAGRFSKRVFQETHGLGKGSSFAGTPTQGLNIYSRGLTHSGTGITQGSTTLNSANGLPVGVSGHSSSSVPGSSLHGFPTTQLSAVQGYPSGAIQTQQIHGFPSGHAQSSNSQSFQPGPTQASYSNYSPVPTQVPHVKSLSSGALQAPTQGLGTKTFSNVPLQGPSVSGFPHSLSSMADHSQGSHYGDPLNPTHRPHSNNFPMNIPQRTHMGRDFRSPSLSSLGSKIEDGVWGRGTNVRGISNQSDTRDVPTQRNMGYGQKYREIQRNEGRFIPKRDLLCRFYARGLCRKGPDCDFRHE